jgi:hypothetical protein
MPKFVVTAPDGKEYEVDAPEGATEQQVLEYVQSNYRSANTPAAETAPARGVGEQLARQAGLAARGVVSGLSAPVNMVADFATGAYNLGAGLLGSSSRLPYMSQAQQQGLTQMGLPTPETGVERAAQTGMQALTGTAGAARAAPAVFGQNLAAQLPAAAAGSVAAQPVAEQVKETTGSDVAATLAGMLTAAVTGKVAGDVAGKATTPRQPTVTMDDVRRRAERSYTAVTNAGIELSPTAGQTLASNITQRLEGARYLPENAQPIRVALDRINQVVGRGPVSFDEVSQLRQIANDLKGNPDRNVGRLANVMVGEIDDFVSRLSPRDVTSGAAGIDEAVRTLASARKDWRNLSRANTLENVLNVAEARALDPKASESELIRRGFINLAADQNKMRLFTPNEQNAIKAVAKGGALDPLLSFIGRFNPERTQLVSGGIVAGGVASPETLKYSLPTAAAGFAADKLQSTMRQRAARQAISGLLSGTTPPPAPSYYVPGLLGSVLAPPEVP